MNEWCALVHHSLIFMNQKGINISNQLWWSPAAVASAPQLHSGPHSLNPVMQQQCQQLHTNQNSWSQNSREYWSVRLTIINTLLYLVPLIGVQVLHWTEVGAIKIAKWQLCLLRETSLQVLTKMCYSRTTGGISVPTGSQKVYRIWHLTDVSLSTSGITLGLMTTMWRQWKVEQRGAPRVERYLQMLMA